MEPFVHDALPTRVIFGVGTLPGSNPRSSASASAECSC